MTDVIGIWSHALAAIAFVALALWQTRGPKGGMRRRMLALAFALTAAWALAVALAGPGAFLARLGETLRNLGWLGFMFSLLLQGIGQRGRSTIVALYLVLVGVALAQIGVDLFVGRVIADASLTEAGFFSILLLRMTFAVGALVLVHNLYLAATPDARWGIRLPMIALGAMWIYDLNLYTVTYLTHRWSIGLYAGRGVILLLLAPLFALASRRNTRWRMRISRTVTFQSLSLMAIGFYLIAMVIVARAIELIGGDYVQLAQVTVVFGISVAMLAFLPIDRIRAWIKVKIAKHLFQHRYDYRQEWMRFTDTVGRPTDDADALDVRVIQAIADITESPGGLLLTPDGSGGLALQAQWKWSAANVPTPASDAAFLRQVEEIKRIVEFDAARREEENAGATTTPEWILDEPRAWAGVPLIHYDRLVGIVLLARPQVDRHLDWEDFDLLRVAGRQVASYLAEARGQEALAESRRFDEFNRRFAFIMHDIKNLVSQLSLLTRNAERHADNPDFRADMIATLRSSTAKMNDLLARLSQHHTGRPSEPQPVALRALAEAVAHARAHQHKVKVEGPTDVVASADPARLEQALGHIVQNAIDVSPPDEPVWVHIERRGLEAALTVADRGAGMSAEFIRTQLYKPFASTKPSGFGIGAFEARSLIAAMGGRLEVESREGAGTRFTIVLPVTRITAGDDHIVQTMDLL